MWENIAILGGGNLGQAIASGLIESNHYTPANITITRRNLQGVQGLVEKGISVTSDNSQAIQNAGIVILCVQPKQLTTLLEEVKDDLNPDEQVLVSSVTGVSIAEIEATVGDKFAMVRATPNTAIAIGESMTSMASKNTGENSLKKVKAIFDTLGKTIVIDEELMSAATVLGASGIAFCLRYIRAAAQGGIEMGFHAEEAETIAVQTCKGAASLLMNDENHPETEIDKVTTPRGCTIAGLNEMEHNGFSSALIKGILASYYKIGNIKS